MATAPLEFTDDPRVTGEFVEVVSGEAATGDVVLVGAVHDHPASKFRAATVVDAVDPDAVALELPPLAVPLFERYARDERRPPALGGEMSAAVQAATTARVVGVDGPTLAFSGRLLRAMYRERVSHVTAARTLRALGDVTRHSVACRLAAVRSSVRSDPVELDVVAASYDVDCSDDPAAQAADERTQVERARSVLSAFGASPSNRLRNATREAYMADRLAALRRQGTVVAVVGIDHLDALDDHLRGQADP